MNLFFWYYQTIVNQLLYLVFTQEEPFRIPTKAQIISYLFNNNQQRISFQKEKWQVYLVRISGSVLRLLKFKKLDLDDLSEQQPNQRLGIKIGNSKKMFSIESEHCRISLIRTF